MRERAAEPPQPDRDDRCAPKESPPDSAQIVKAVVRGDAGFPRVTGTTSTWFRCLPVRESGCPVTNARSLAVEAFLS
jgi:hypothetical protein